MKYAVPQKAIRHGGVSHRTNLLVDEDNMANVDQGPRGRNARLIVGETLSDTAVVPRTDAKIRVVIKLLSSMNRL